MVQDWVKDLTESVLGGAPVEIGKRYHHPVHGIITITAGQYWGKHGISNFWYWTDENGDTHNGYGEDWKRVD